MTRPEDRLRATVRDSINRVYPGENEQSWVESHATSPGFPDLEACARSVVKQIELKVAAPNGSVHIRPTQYRWFRDRVHAGGTPLMWVQCPTNGWHLILPGHVVKNFENVNDIVTPGVFRDVDFMTREPGYFTPGLQFNMFNNPDEAVRFIFERAR